MSQAQTFQAERFYFGTLIQNGQVSGSPQVLAKSAGITQAHVQECLRLIRLAPPSAEQTSAQMPSAIGLFHGESIEHIFLKAQRTAEGIPQLVYWLLPEMAMRWLGGNYQLLMAAGQEAIPSFAAVQPEIPPVKFENPQPLEDSAQVEFLYDLFRYSGDKVRNVEGLSAALIHHMPIAILNAPADLKIRMSFIQGLLCLLPAPARVGMTWATAVEKPEETIAGVKFLNRPVRPSNHLWFDWAEGKLLNEAPNDKYSRFIASRLRLDASQVVETTTSVARTAIWRAMRKDSLPQALYVASRRAAVDEAVQNNQPAERELVAAILRQDPTLADEMRVKYARHLLAFTLSLDDEPEHADVIPMVAAKNRPIAETIYGYLKDIAGTDRPLKVFELMERWLLNVAGSNVIPWHRLAHIGAIAHFESLLKAGSFDDALVFLGRLLRADERLQVAIAVPQLIAAARPYVGQSPKLAMGVFLLGIEFLSTAQFQKMLADYDLMRALPPRIRDAAAHLQIDQRPSPPPGLLVNAAAEVVPQYRLLLIGKLGDTAVQLKRGGILIDSRMMASLLRLAESQYAERFPILFDYLVREYSQPQNLHRLETPAQELLPLIFFQIGQMDSAIRLLENFQFTLFTADKLPTFVDLVGRIFSKITLPAEKLEKLFELLDNSKLRPKPRVRAYSGVLTGNKWSRELQPLARRLTSVLQHDSTLTQVIGLESAMQLLAFHADLEDKAAVLQTGSALLEVALEQQQKGIPLVEKIWERLRWDAEIEKAGLDLLRRYIRESDISFAPTLPARFAERMGSEIGEQLSATFTMRVLFGDSDLKTFCNHITMAASLLYDVATTYGEGKDRPPLHRLRQMLDTMSGNLNDNERQAIGVSVEYIARAVYVLANQRQSGRHPKVETLLANSTAPTSALDMLYFISGHFGGKTLEAVDFRRVAPTYVMGNRSAHVLTQEMPVIARFMGNLLRAYPPDKAPKLQPEAIIGELESRWRLLYEPEQKQIQPDLITNSQHLPQIVVELGKGTGERVLSDKGLQQGKKQPENGLQALVWISGYFNRLHQG